MLLAILNDVIYSKNITRSQWKPQNYEGNKADFVIINVRADPYEPPLLWLVFGTVGHYVDISNYVADHTKRFQMIS